MDAWEAIQRELPHIKRPRNGGAKLNDLRQTMKSGIIIDGVEVEVSTEACIHFKVHPTQNSDQRQVQKALEAYDLPTALPPFMQKYTQDHGQKPNHPVVQKVYKTYNLIPETHVTVELFQDDREDIELAHITDESWWDRAKSPHFWCINHASR